jgi:hypothetical protein
MMVAELSPPMPVENILLNQKQKINMKGSIIRGCSLLPDGRVVFYCYNTDIVRFMDKDGVELFEIGKGKTGYYAYDTVDIKDNNSVAVSSNGFNRRIPIINFESQEVMTTISMDTTIFGMTVKGGTIYYCAGEKGLNMLNLSDKSVSDITNSNMSEVYYIATSGDKLYYTNSLTNIVTCCDSHGTKQWAYHYGHVLQGPRGISLDNDGNLYVVGHRSNNLMVISPDGQRYRQLLSSTDGLVNPFVLDYDKSTNMLLVVNEERTAFLFDVTRKE